MYEELYARRYNRVLSSRIFVAGEARLLAMARQKYCGGAVRATGPAPRHLDPSLAPPDDHTKLICAAALWVNPLAALALPTVVRATVGVDVKAIE